MGPAPRRPRRSLPIPRGGFIRRVQDGIDHVARHSPARLALTIFASIIAVITALLSLPQATAGDESASFADALFTAVSAVCVTGLTVVPTAEYWSNFGQTVILVAIKVGGLGIMTLASILALAISHRIGLTQKMLAASETKEARLGEVGTLVRAVVIASLVIETVLTLVLVPRFLALGDSIGTAIWHGLFMSISIFNNAGFVVLVEGIEPLAGDWWFGLPLIFGAAVGALGFPVILDISKSLRHRKRSRRRSFRVWRTWTLHTKLTLATYSILAVAGAIAVGALEWGNEATFGALDPVDRLLAAGVHSVAPRSSGLATVDISAMSESTWFVMDALMFVGGGSASTAGGIKVTTFAVMVLAIVAEARGDRDVEAFGKRIGSSVVRLAVAVAFLGATLVGAGTLALLLITDFRLGEVLFEVISAFATVGLTTGITDQLPDAGKYVLSALMFLGRTGTISFAAALALRERRRLIRRPNERPVIG
ncbi:Trk-type K+ transport system membrane component [Bogoriella caseilytica]|uniref:Trk-type K+ transport system membrane component n=1 Tax=Bogoriella caseilytica TaxID=56055 RepID=A0A3N2BAP8_9MICO|nr:Trk-type K+ transport system membrane component [Bogoriella caseilytica]